MAWASCVQVWLRRVVAVVLNSVALESAVRWPVFLLIFFMSFTVWLASLNSLAMVLPRKWPARGGFVGQILVRMC